MVKHSQNRNYVILQEKIAISNSKFTTLLRRSKINEIVNSSNHDILPIIPKRLPDTLSNIQKLTSKYFSSSFYWWIHALYVIGDGKRQNIYYSYKYSFELTFNINKIR